MPSGNTLAGGSGTDELRREEIILNNIEQSRRSDFSKEESGV